MATALDDVYRGMGPRDLIGKPYARYWNPTMAPERAEVTAALAAGFQAPERALEFSDAAKLQAAPDEQRYFETGYARLRSGSYYVAVETPMPGVTGKMLLWWFGWHGEETQRYKLWHPKDHLSVRTRVNRAAHLYNGAWTRHLGIVSHVKEYVGSELQSLAIAFAPPEAFGLSETSREAAGIEAAICARIGYSRGPLAFGNLVHLVQRTESGAMVMRSRFWLGDVTLGPVAAGRGIRLLIGSMIARRFKITESQVRALLTHCAAEMQHLASFLPNLYQELGPR
ncbi:MAG: hypothetical protein FJ146_07705 [Deltaproteobacteria bacterium]|nr:hypothetical protein [Deltaproteobacteria bacterium]